MQTRQPFAAATVQETWSAGAFDSLRLFSLHLSAIGVSGAAARTAVAPLERIKVSGDLQDAMLCIVADMASTHSRRFSRFCCK